MTTYLSDCCKFQEGYVNPPQHNPKYFDGRIKWLRSLDLNNSYVYNTSRTLTEEGFNSAGKSASLFPKDSLAISKSGTIGELGILKDTMCGNRAVINIDVIPEKADLMYVFYLLKYKKREIIKKAVGSIQKNLYVSELGAVMLCHDDIETQKRISSVLSSIDSKIENNNAINAELEALAKTIYDYWFLQFEFPNEEGLPYKSSGGRMVWSEELKREIPEGWEVKKIRDIIVSKRISVDASELPEDAKYVGLEHIPRRKIIVDSFGSTDDVDSNKLVAKDGDILFGKIRPYLHKVSILPFDVYCSSDALVLNSKRCLDYAFSAITLFSDNFVNHSIKITQGSKMPRAEWKDISEYPLVLPIDDILTKYNNLVLPGINQMKKGVLENQELAALRDWLLPMLMNGQVGFKDTE